MKVRFGVHNLSDPKLLKRRKEKEGGLWFTRGDLIWFFRNGEKSQDGAISVFEWARAVYTNEGWIGRYGVWPLYGIGLWEYENAYRGGTGWRGKFWIKKRKWKPDVQFHSSLRLLKSWRLFFSSLPIFCPSVTQNAFDCMHCLDDINISAWLLLCFLTVLNTFNTSLPWLLPLFTSKKVSQTPPMTNEQTNKQKQFLIFAIPDLCPSINSSKSIEQNLVKLLKWTNNQPGWLKIEDWRRRRYSI